MRNLKYTLLSMLFSICFFSSWAEATNLLITFTKGQKQTFALNDYPLVTINEDNLNVEIEDMVFKYDINSVNDFKYVEDAGLHGVAVNEIFKIEKGSVFINAEGQDVLVKIFDLKGLQLESLSIAKGTTDRLPLDELQPGVYVIKINDSSIKIIK